MHNSPNVESKDAEPEVVVCGGGTVVVSLASVHTVNRFPVRKWCKYKYTVFEENVFLKGYLTGV